MKIILYVFSTLLLSFSATAEQSVAETLKIDTCLSEKATDAPYEIHTDRQGQQYLRKSDSQNFLPLTFNFLKEGYNQTAVSTEAPTQSFVVNYGQKGGKVLMKTDSASGLPVQRRYFCFTGEPAMISCPFDSFEECNTSFNVLSVFLKAAGK